MTATPGAVPPPPPSPSPAPSSPFASPPGNLPVAADQDDRNLGMLCFLLSIFMGLLPALIIWLHKRERSVFVDDQGKEAINWGITMWVLLIAAFVLNFAAIRLTLAVTLLAPAVFILNAVLCIIASVRASAGQAYRFPFAMRLVK
jgi:uncharacterized protein